MRLLRRLCLRFSHAEEGFGLVSVIGIAGTLFVLTATITVLSVNNLKQVAVERLFEQSLQVADAGVDHALYNLFEDEDYNTGETVPAFATTEEEKNWVLEQAAAKTPVAGPEGEWVAIKPVNAAVIYSVGYAPSQADPDKTRVIRAEYDFTSFSAGVAIMSGDSIDISGQVEVEGEAGSMHSNADIIISGNPEFDGYVSASGDCLDPTADCPDTEVGDPANTGGGKPPMSLPPLSPRELYSASEYDLCPDGWVHKGPSYPGADPNSTGTPCLGDPLQDATGIEYRGWKMGGVDPSKGAKWDHQTDTRYNGVYYVYQGSAKVGSDPGTTPFPWRVTIIAEASPATPEPHCPHVGGDIEISGDPKLTFHDKAQPWVAVAGRDLVISGNPDSGREAAFFAHEQFKISGNPEFYGALISESVCDTLGSAVEGHSIISGNPEISYDGDFELQTLDSSIRTTLWLEL